MEAMKPEAKRAILENRPQASSAEIDEYEKLLAERFSEDPGLPESQAVAQNAVYREKRLRELREKLYGD